MAPEVASIIGALVDRAGTLWVATGSGLYARNLGEARFRRVDDRSFDFGTAGTVLASAPDGAIWAATPNRNAPHRSIRRVRAPAGPSRCVAFRADRCCSTVEGSLWGALRESEAFWLACHFVSRSSKAQRRSTRPSGEILAHGRSHRRRRVRPSRGSRTKHLGRHEPGPGSIQLQQCRHAMPRRARQVRSRPATLAPCGWRAIAVFPRRTRKCAKIRDGAIVSRQTSPAFTVAYRDREGTIWFAGPSLRSDISRGGRLVTVPLPPHIFGGVSSRHWRATPSGAMWVSVYGKGVFRFIDGEWSATEHFPRHCRAHALAAADEAGVLWFGYPDNQIARVDGDGVHVFGTDDGLEVGKVLSILAQDGEVWVGRRARLRALRRCALRIRCRAQRRCRSRESRASSARAMAISG